MRVLPLCLAVVSLCPAAATAVTCDGTERLCLDLVDSAAVAASGGTATGTFSADGFMPADQGGLDWVFGPSEDFSAGRMEVDVHGLVPSNADELAGGKVSIFEFCGEAPETSKIIGVHKMPVDYHTGHIFRAYAATDFAGSGWDCGIWTDGFGIGNWQAGETHHVLFSWDPSGMHLEVDGTPFNGYGSIYFDPSSKRFTLGNRCAHYPFQNAVASFSNLRLWRLGTGLPGQDAGTPPGADAGEPDGGSLPGDAGVSAPDAGGPPGDAPVLVSFAPANGDGGEVTFRAVFGHAQGAGAITEVALSLGDPTAPGNTVQARYRADGGMANAAGSCAPGARAQLDDGLGWLDCGRATASAQGNELTVEWPLRFDEAAFAGEHGVWVDAFAGSAALGWTRAGSFTVAPSPPAAGTDGGGGAGAMNATTGCGCNVSPDGALGLCAALGLLLASARRRRRA